MAAVAACTRGRASAEEVPAGPAVSPVPAAVAAKVRLVEVARGLQRPVALAQAPGDPRRLYVVEQIGRIRILEDGVLTKTVALDVRKQVSRDNEQGLLGLAFHPKFADNRKLYVNWTDLGGKTHVTEYLLPKATPTVVDVKSARDVLVVKQPYSNHNGGHLVFGPDGQLWIGLGDGGAANDPDKNGQNKTALLAKMLRLDVDVRPAARPSIHMLGLRNPWRYSFDRKTGDLYIGDVGQDIWEEIDVVAAKDALAGQQNFGWNQMEGSHCFRRNCKRAGMTLPVVDYDHQTGCSVTGGAVYRGAALPVLDGLYFYADYCTGIVRSFRWKPGTPALAARPGVPARAATPATVTDHWDWRAAIDAKEQLTSVSMFAEDLAGEIYVLSLDGKLWKLVAPGPTPTPTPTPTPAPTPTRPRPRPPG